MSGYGGELFYPVGLYILGLISISFGYKLIAFPFWFAEEFLTLSMNLSRLKTPAPCSVKLSPCNLSAESIKADFMNAPF
jgi:hypothetical protein